MKRQPGLYVLRAWINSLNKRTGRVTTDEVALKMFWGREGLKTAKREFKIISRDWRICEFSYSERGISRTGVISLFQPELRDDGQFAYWPLREPILKETFNDE